MGNSLNQLTSPFGVDVISIEHRLLAACAKADLQAVQTVYQTVVQQATSSHRSNATTRHPSPEALSRFIDVNLHLPDGDFALMLACSRANLPIAELLIERLNANVNEQDATGSTCLMTLMHLSIAQAMPLIRLLCLEGQCDLMVRDQQGMTALHYAARLHSESRVLRFLLSLDNEYKTGVHSKDSEQNTPLLTLLLQNRCQSMTAVQEMVVTLIEAGASPNVANIDGLNAWEAAIQREVSAIKQRREEEEAERMQAEAEAQERLQSAGLDAAATLSKTSSGLTPTHRRQSSSLARHQHNSFSAVALDNDFTDVRTRPARLHHEIAQDDEELQQHAAYEQKRRDEDGDAQMITSLMITSIHRRQRHRKRSCAASLRLLYPDEKETDDEQLLAVVDVVALYDNHQLIPADLELSSASSAAWSQTPTPRRLSSLDLNQSSPGLPDILAIGRSILSKVSLDKDASAASSPSSPAQLELVSIDRVQLHSSPSDAAEKTRFSSCVDCRYCNGRSARGRQSGHREW